MLLLKSNILEQFDVLIHRLIDYMSSRLDYRKIYYNRGGIIWDGCLCRGRVVEMVTGIRLERPRTHFQQLGRHRADLR